MVSLSVDGGQLGGLQVLRNKLHEDVGRDGAFCAENRQLFGDTFQLTDVARPLITHQHLLGLVGQDNLVHAVFLCHLKGKEAEQQYDVLTTVAQGRNLYLHLVQTVVEVLAETAFADGFLDVDIRGSHDAHIGLANLRTTNRDVFAILQHT